MQVFPKRVKDGRGANLRRAAPEAEALTTELSGAGRTSLDSLGKYVSKGYTIG